MHGNARGTSVVLLVITVSCFCLIWASDSSKKRIVEQRTGTVARRMDAPAERLPIPQTQPLPQPLAVSTIIPPSGIPPMTIATAIQIFKDIILGCAAIFTATMAYRGLSTWRKELKGNAVFENARRFLLCLYKTRNAISAVRNSYMSPGEIETAMVEAGHPAEQVAQLARENGVDQAVYNRRWAALADTIAPLQVELLEMEVLHGEKIRELYRELNSVILDLRHALSKYLRNLAEERETHVPVRARPDRHEEQERLTRIIWEDYEDVVTKDTNGPTFSKRLKAAISNLESFAKPYLKE